MATAAILSGHGAMPKRHKEPDPPESGGQQQSPPMDQRLLDIKRRVERRFYDSDPVVKEVVEALVENQGHRRAKGYSSRK